MGDPLLDLVGGFTVGLVGPSGGDSAGVLGTRGLTRLGLRGGRDKLEVKLFFGLNLVLSYLYISTV